MAKLNSEDKNYFVFLHLVKPASLRSSVWIGLSLDSKNNYHWSDGARLEYSNWGPGSPDTSPGNSKNCSKLNDVSGLWEDSECDFTHIYVCERGKYDQNFEARKKLSFPLKKRLEDGRHMPSPALGVDIISVQSKQSSLELAYD